MSDHVKMRVVHVGPKEHHVHHLHAHQWLRTPDSDESVYTRQLGFRAGLFVHHRDRQQRLRQQE